MTALARRGILRLFGGIAVAAPRAAAFVASGAAASPLNLGMIGYAGSADCASSIGPNGYALSRDPIMAFAQQAFVKADRRHDRKRERRIGGLDPDLAALGSTSLAWRMLAQQRRDRSELTALDKLRRVVFRKGDESISIYEAFGGD